MGIQQITRLFGEVGHAIANDKRRWWALIPAGVLVTLGMVVGLGSLFPGWEAGAVFFLGLAATFTVLYLLPEGEEWQAWALYPALALVALAVLSSGLVGATFALWPLAPIGAGVYLLWQRAQVQYKEF